MTTSSTNIPNNTESGKYTVSANKDKIETTVKARLCCNFSDRIIKKTTTRVKTEAMLNITVT